MCNNAKCILEREKGEIQNVLISHGYSKSQVLALIVKLNSSQSGSARLAKHFPLVEIFSDVFKNLQKFFKWTLVIYGLKGLTWYFSPIHSKLKEIGYCEKISKKEIEDLGEKVTMLYLSIVNSQILNIRYLLKTVFLV